MSLHDLQLRLQHVLPDARLKVTGLPECAGLSLYLLDDSYAVEQLAPETACRVMDDPLYWLFCWASGLVMARQILAEPDRVRGKTVLDVGCGSGVVAIAAAMAGAARVVACDLDPVARLATALNAAQNGVRLDIIGDFADWQGPVDLITVADVLYDRDNLPLLTILLARAPVWLADSRMKNLSHPQLAYCETLPGHTFPSLGGFDEFTEVNLYQSR
ncbi:MAG TPA: 50S ribosomal protein L11 methyltransferase [Pseudomonadales bacterium]